MLPPCHSMSRMQQSPALHHWWRHALMLVVSMWIISVTLQRRLQCPGVRRAAPGGRAVAGLATPTVVLRAGCLPSAATGAHLSSGGLQLLLQGLVVRLQASVGALQLVCGGLRSPQLDLMLVMQVLQLGSRLTLALCQLLASALLCGCQALSGGLRLRPPEGIGQSSWTGLAEALKPLPCSCSTGSVAALTEGEAGGRDSHLSFGIAWAARQALPSDTCWVGASLVRSTHAQRLLRTHWGCCSVSCPTWLPPAPPGGLPRQPCPLLPASRSP